MSISPIFVGCAAGWLASQILKAKSTLLKEPHCVATCDSTAPLEFTDYDAAAEASLEDCFRDISLQLSRIFNWGIGWSITLAIFYFSLAANICLGGDHWPSPQK